jgi:hypothetical protein
VPEETLRLLDGECGRQVGDERVHALPGIYLYLTCPSLLRLNGRRLNADLFKQGGYG